ncbi:hypothetical protein HGRIS_008567 [Hohenbuehelia grisea]|uniref:Uncharacterized protein n=1 Tax=Hohenbuehelia grisea TaxID=104357 RepID=A0ABR3J8L8_9AGAR
MRMSGFLTALAGYVPVLDFSASPKTPEYGFRGGDGEFLPRDLISLRKAEEGVANVVGDLVMVPFSRYNVTEAENKKHIRISSFTDNSLFLDIPLSENDQYFWLDSRTLAYVTAVDTDSGYRHNLHVVPLRFLPGTSSSGALASLKSQSVGLLAENTNNPRFYRYMPESEALVYYDDVWKDGKEPEPVWHGDVEPPFLDPTSPDFIWDDQPITPTLFAVNLSRNAHEEWILGPERYSLVDNNMHSPDKLDYCDSPAGFDVSTNHILYSVSPPIQRGPTSDAQCTCTNSTYGSDLYLGTILKGVAPKKLTDRRVRLGSVALNRQGSKVAWVELPVWDSSCETAKIMVYDIKTNTSATVLSGLDVTPQEIAFSIDGNSIYFVAGANTTVSVYMLSSTLPSIASDALQAPMKMDHSFEPILTSPSARGIQPMPDGRIMFTQFTHKAPSEVFVAQGPGYSNVSQVTIMNGDILSSKSMLDAERFEYAGVNNVTKYGWVMKPRGWTQDQATQWPAVLILYSGPAGAWADQWSTLWNPNIFAQQGFFCALIDPAPEVAVSQGTETDPNDGSIIANVRNSWDRLIQDFPEIDRSKAILLDYMVQGLFETDGQGPPPNHGLNFARIETLWSNEFSPGYDGLIMQDIAQKYDFLATVVPPATQVAH